MSPEDLRKLLELYRKAMAEMTSALDDGRLESLEAPALRVLLRDVIEGYEARIGYERLEAALAHSEKLTEAVFGRKMAVVPSGKPELTLVQGGKSRAPNA